MEGVIGSQADYARHRECSRAYVGKLVKAGKITLTSDRKIVFADADFALKVLADPARQGVGKSQEQTEAREQSSLLDQADLGPRETSHPAVPTIAKAKIATELYTARLKELEYNKRVGNLLPKAEVLAAFEDAGQMIAQALDALVANSAEIASAGRVGGEEAVRACLKEKIKAVRELVANSLTKAASGEGDEDGDE